jgi:alcohol dehydrogenase class IV
MELATSYRYLSPSTRIHAGEGSLSQISSEARRLGSNRCFVVCSETVARTTNLLDRVKTELGDTCVGIYDNAKKESPIPLVMAGVEAARNANPDCIIAVGGGSAVVTARAITILMAENGTPQELCTKYTPGQPPESPRLLKPKIPQIVVLTTPTNGVNRGGAAVMDDKPPFRLELFDPKARPACIILDGEALLTAPLSLFLDTSITTFAGLLSSIQSPNLNPFNYADIREALAICIQYLPEMIWNPKDPNSRIQLAAASILVNRASDAPSVGGRGAGIATSMDRELRYSYEHIGQGASRLIMTLAEMKRNRSALQDGQIRLGELFGIRSDGITGDQATGSTITAIETFLNSIGIPTRLRDLDVPEADLAGIAQRDSVQPSFGEGGRRITDVNDLHSLLKEVW